MNENKSYVFNAPQFQHSW